MFAGRRVAAFTVAAVAALGALGALSALAACSGPAPGGKASFDAAPPEPPGPCVVTRTALVACEAGPEAVADASPIDASADDGEAPDGGEPTDASPPDDASPDASSVPLAPPASENRCLVTQDVSFACPSYVGSMRIAAGQEGTSDVLIAQRGLAYYANPEVAALSNDNRAYVQVVHLDARGNGSVTMNPIEPYAVGMPPSAGIGLLPGAATRNASLVTFSAATKGYAMRAGALVPGAAVVFGAPFDIPDDFSPTLFASRSGEGFVAARSRTKPNAPLALVRGLPGAPRSVTTNVPGDELLMATTDPSGTPAGLVGKPDGSAVRLLEGEAFEKERWSSGTRGTSAADLVYVEEPSGAVPAVLLGGGGNETTAHVLRSPAADAPYAVIGKSFSSCPRSTYVGVTCDACPVTKQCETGNDRITAARLFTRAGRLFAVYYSTDVRRRMAYVLDKTIIGIGCVCSLVEREKTEYADSLVVVEIIAPADAKEPPAVVERMRLPLFKAHAAVNVVLSPRTDGDVDVLLGPFSASYESAVTKLPEQPTPLRMLRLSTKSIP